MFQVSERQLYAYQLCYEIEHHLREIINTFDISALKLKYQAYKDLVYIATKVTFVITGENVDKLIRANTVRQKVSRMRDVTEEDITILEDCRNSLPSVPKVKRIS
ncbi:hypothetical protein [Halalkalibacter flavus]|jgi:phage-related holin|uniref:hypothetical protein n=1 Tax=Halalkalibacter flavus TaxID=3090668 RepID=UPI002FCB3DFF